MKKIVTICAVVCMAATAAQATVVLQDNFDGYANQAAFETAWPAIGTVAPTSAVLSSTKYVSASQSIELPGTAENSHYRNRRSFTETGTVTETGPTSQIAWSFDFYDQGTTVNPSPARNYCNLQDTTAPSGTNQLVAMGFNNNQTGAQSGGQYYMARILGYTPSTTADPDGGPAESVGSAGSFFKLNDFGVGLRPTSAAWVNLKAVISTDDGLSTDYAFYVNGVLAERVSNVGSTASMRSYDNIAIGSGVSNANVQAFVDNMDLQLVPEPGAIALLVLGSLGSLSLRRRRRA